MFELLRLFVVGVCWRCFQFSVGCGGEIGSLGGYFGVLFGSQGSLARRGSFGVLFGSQGVLGDPFWRPKIDFWGPRALLGRLVVPAGALRRKLHFPPPHFGVNLGQFQHRKSLKNQS